MQQYIIGIDEVGRGPLAGPLVVCVCAIKVGTDVLPFFPKGKLRDSKKLSEVARNSIVKNIEPLVVTLDIVVGVGEVSAEEIDRQGLSLSIKIALAAALAKIHEQGVPKDSFIFLDGSLHADVTYAQETIIKGDEKIPEIAIASIVAKVYRDTFMKKVAEAYPNYGFESHVGYGTAFHYAALKKYGITPLHRKSFLKKMVGTNEIK